MSHDQRKVIRYCKDPACKVTACQTGRAEERDERERKPDPTRYTEWVKNGAGWGAK